MPSGAVRIVLTSVILRAGNPRAGPSGARTAARDRAPERRPSPPPTAPAERNCKAPRRSMTYLPAPRSIDRPTISRIFSLSVPAHKNGRSDPELTADESEGQGVRKEAAANRDEQGVGTHRVTHAGAPRGE